MSLEPGEEYQKDRKTEGLRPGWGIWPSMRQAPANYFLMMPSSLVQLVLWPRQSAGEGLL